MSNNIKTYASEQYVNEAINEAIENIDFPEVSGTSGKMDKSNPTGTGSLSINRLADSTIGAYSVAEGYKTTASGAGSHAEGSQTIASADSAHAEGIKTTASTKYSHAEGSNTNTDRDYQHVQGKWNAGSTTETGDLVHIVGYGTGANNQKNIHTVNTDGEGWFEGDVYVHSTSHKNKDGGSKKLATEEYVDDHLSGLSTAMVFKGTLGTGGTITSLPVASTDLVGDTYKVITAGTYASQVAKVGDVFTCSEGLTWVLIPSGDEPSGTVTNVATGTGLTGGPITSSGTISLKTATASEIGGVKSGTDITVDSSGNVSVNDDSHKHNASTLQGVLPLTGGYLNGNLGINKKYELGSHYDYQNGYLIEIGDATQYNQVAIHITGNGYAASEASINSMLQFYNYGGSSIINAGGVNFGGILGNMVVYNYNNKIYAHIKQGRNYQTLSFTLISNQSDLTPTVTNAAAHNADDCTNVTTITPKKLSDIHTHNYAGSATPGGAANSAIQLTTYVAGSYNIPTYFNDGKPVACTSIKNTLVSWEGDNVKGGVSPLGVAISPEHSANRIAYLNPNAIIIEASNDGGATWSATSYTNEQKTAFVTTDTPILVGASHPATINSQTRVTLAPAGAVYCNIRKILMYVSNPLHDLQVTVETITSETNATWKAIGTYPLGGFSGWNDLPVNVGTLGGSSGANVKNIRFIFSIKTINNTYPTSECLIRSIRLFGENCWIAASNMGKHGHLYDYDTNQNATFPALVKGTAFTDKDGNEIYAKKTEITPVGNGTLTITQNGVSKGTFTANQSGNVTIALTDTDTDTKYTHPAYTARSHGLYKITVDGTGHVSEATAVGKNDITALGIPSSDTNTTYDLGASPSSTNGNVKLNLTASGSGSGTDSVAIKGSGATTVTTDANGVITISSTDNNTVYTHPAYTAITGKPTGNQTPAFGGTVTVSQISSDNTGHVTGATDRTITIPGTLSNGTGTAGLIKTSSSVTNSSGYTACPVINGVPYYKDTNNTYTLDSFGVSTETWTFTLADGSTVTKAVCIK